MDRPCDEGRHDLTSSPQVPAATPTIEPQSTRATSTRAPQPWVPIWTLVHAGTLVLAAVVLLWVNRNQWFFGDEWEFLVSRGLTDARLNLLLGHNEHWTTVPILVFVALRDTFGVSSYWPYICVLVAVHLLLVHLLWRVMRRSVVSPIVAAALTAVFALLGAGSENLLWAFQITLVGSVLAGWAAALVVDRSPVLCRKDGWAVFLLVIALMCSGIGIPMVGVVALVALARSRSVLRALIIGGIPTIVFGLWFVLVPQRPQPPLGAAIDDGIAGLVTFVVDALGESIAAASGLSALAGLLLLVSLATWTVVKTVDVFRRRPGAVDHAIALAGVYGAAAFFLLSGFGRTDASAARYVYVAIAMMLPAIGLALTDLARPVWAQAALAVALTVVLVVNVTMLVRASDIEADRERTAKDTIVAAASLIANGEPIVNQAPDPVFDPDLIADALPSLIADGLPTEPVTEDGLRAARLHLQVNPYGTAFPDPFDAGTPPTIEQEIDISGQDVTAQEIAGLGVPDPDLPVPGSAGGCVRYTPAGSNPRVVLVMPGDRTTFTVSSTGTAGAFAVSLRPPTAAADQLAQDLGPTETRVVLSSLPAGTRLILTLAFAESIVCHVQ